MDITLKLKNIFTALGILIQTSIVAQLPTVQSAMPVYSEIKDNAVMVTRDSQDNIYSAYEIIGTLPGGNAASQEFHLGSQLSLALPPIIGPYNPSGYHSDVIIMKQNSAGAIQWGLRTQGNFRERIKSIKTDQNNDLLIGGSISGPEGRFWGATFPFSTDEFSVHGFLSKMDGSGNLLWEKVFSADITNYALSGLEDPRGVTVQAVTNDNQGNVYAQIKLNATSVVIDGTTFINANPPNSVNNNQADVIIAKFSPAGNLLWAKQMTSTHGVSPIRIAVNNQNELIITGDIYGDQYYDTQLLTNWAGSSYIMKINSDNGQLIWNLRPEGLWFPTGLDTDSAGNIYIAGALSPGTFVFGSDTLNNPSYSISATQALMMKVNSTGNIVWGKTARRTGNGVNIEAERCADVKVKPDGNLLFLGNFRHQDIDFGNGLLLTNTYYTSYYPNDIFFAEYTTNGNPLRVKKLGDNGNEGSSSFAVKADGSIAFNGYYYQSTQLDNIFVSGGDGAQPNCFVAFMSSWNNTNPVDTTPPTAPLNLTVTGTTTNSVSLSWTAATDNVGVTSYEVFMNGVYYGYVTGTTITVPGLAANTTYSFYVRAKDLFGNVSPNSNTVSATTLFDSQFGTDLYISEYVEGTGDNKALEITNPTANLIDMSMYSFRKQINGSGPWVGNYQLSGFIDTDEAYVITNTNANFNCWFDPDFETLSPMDFDGNDPIGLFKNGVLIDVVGNFNSSAVFGQDVSLWRNVYNPTTTFNPAQWTNFPVDYCDDLLIANPDRYALGVSETAQNKKLKIYPNPVSETLFFGEPVQNAKIYSLDGKLVRSKISGKEVNVQNLPTGNYIITGETRNKKTFSAKFIKK